MTPAQIAPIIYAAMQEYQNLLGQTIDPPWEHAVAEKIAMIQWVALAAAQPPPTPDALHEAWRVARLSEGWRLPPPENPVKDTAKKLDPAIAPYNSLSASEQAKDLLVLGVTRALLKA